MRKPAHGVGQQGMLPLRSGLEVALLLSIEAVIFKRIGVWQGGFSGCESWTVTEDHLLRKTFALFYALLLLS